MPYNPDTHHRRSIRLDGYDYAQVGAYFVTMCVQNNTRLFGTICDGAVQMNAAGLMIDYWRSALSSKFPSITTDAFVVMPNHVHGIIVINAGNAGAHAGAPLRNDTNAVGADQCACPDENQCVCPDENQCVCPDASLVTIIQWFKTMTTNAYIRAVREHGWPQFDRRLWQRNYYERIIRDEAAFDAIRRYIVNNPRR